MALETRSRTTSKSRDDYSYVAKISDKIVDAMFIITCASFRPKNIITSKVVVSCADMLKI